MVKKKKGSTLIITAIIFMFVIIVSAAMLSVVRNNYKMRVIESQRLQNLYASESGLEVVSNIINKNLSAAINYGNEKVNKLDEVEKYSPEEFKKFYEDHQNNEEYNYPIMYRVLLDDIGYQDTAVSKKLISEGKAEENKKQDRADIEKVKNSVFKEGIKEFLEIKGTNRPEKNVGNETQDTGINSRGNILVNSIENLYYVANKSEDVKGEKYDKKYIELEKEPIIFVGDKGKTKEPLEEQKAKSEHRDGIQYWSKNPKFLPEGKRELFCFFGDYTQADANGNQEMIWHSYDTNFQVYDEEGCKVKVTSEFKTSKDTTNVKMIGENMRTIQSAYELRIPNYDEVKYGTIDNTKLGEQGQLVDLPKITVGKDMKIESNLNVNGDIFVQGEESKDNTVNTDKARLIDKYSGGIVLGKSVDSTDKKKINFNGEVVTRGTFNIKNNVDILLNKDLYARNLYVGDIEGINNNIVSNSILNAKSDVVLDNDLTFKGQNTQLTIKNFYGINDKNTKYGTNYNESNMPKQKTSSSIIVNEFDKDCLINVTDSAYLMGVAHINTESGYQTGESVAVKGNYEAYAVPEEYVDSNGNVINDAAKIQYDNPLQVLNDDDVFNKSKHFYVYWKDKEDKEGQASDIRTGKIRLPKADDSEKAKAHPKQGTYSIGAVVSELENGKTNVLGENFNNDFMEFIDSKQKDYADKVYKLANDNKKDSKKLYDSLELPDTVEGDILKNISKLNSEDVAKIYKLEAQKNKIYKAICSNDYGKTIVIKGDGASGAYDNDSRKYEVFNADDKNLIKAVIVTDADVIIDGNVSFLGDIITSGKMIVKGNSTVSIKYDKAVVDEVEKENLTLFNVLFGDGQANKNNGEDNQNPAIESNSNEFIKNGLWKIIK